MRLVALGFVATVALGIAGSPRVPSAQPVPGAARCAVPAVLADGWDVAPPDRVGFDAAALCETLESVAHGEANIHGLVVVRHGRLVAELYRRGRDRSVWSVFTHETAFDAGTLHDVRSVTKTVVSLLFGIARQRHAIDVRSSPLAFYPEYASLHAPDRDRITIEHVLTMSSGLEWNESATTYGSLRNDETSLFWAWSPARRVLSRPVVAEPGMRFNYNGGGTLVLADIVARTTGMPLREFARVALFEPLGIRDWQWVGDLYGRPLAFAGLRLRPRDLAKIGRMVLAHGRWDGRQIVPAEWLAESLRPRIAAADRLQYGYQWWLGTAEWQGRHLAWAAAVGNGGQRLFVVPDLDLAVVVTAGAYNDRTIGPVVTGIFRRIAAAVRA